MDMCSYLYLFDIGHHQTLCRIHSNTNIVVCLLCDSGTLGIDRGIEDGVVMESQRECLDDHGHVGETNPLLQESLSDETAKMD